MTRSRRTVLNQVEMGVLVAYWSGCKTDYEAAGYEIEGDKVRVSRGALGSVKRQICDVVENHGHRRPKNTGEMLAAVRFLGEKLIEG